MGLSRLQATAAALANIPLYLGNYQVQSAEAPYVVDPTFPVGDARRYGVVADGATDNTAAYLGAVAATTALKVPLVLPAGTLLGHLEILPGHGFHLTGAGVRRTVLRATIANRPLVRSADTTNAVFAARIEHFSVQPLATSGAGSGSAIDLAGIHSSMLESVDYLANGAGFFDSFIALSAHRNGTFATCYFNRISNPSCREQAVGPTTGILFENDGGGVDYNANGISIEGASFYANNGITRVIDALRSASVTITNAFIESNLNAISVRMGTQTTIRGGWYEANIANGEIEYDTAADGSSNASSVVRAYFSSVGTITFVAGVQDNTWVDCTHNKTFVDLGTNNNVRTGNNVVGAAANVSTRLTNSHAGGGAWQWIISATGGLFPAGSFGLQDITNGLNAMIFYAVSSIGLNAMFARKATTAALSLAPLDNSNPTTTPVLNGYVDGTLGTEVWRVNKDGSGRFTNLGVGNSAAATGPVGAITKKIQVFDKNGTALGFIPVYTTIT